MLQTTFVALLYLCASHFAHGFALATVIRPASESLAWYTPITRMIRDSAAATTIESTRLKYSSFGVSGLLFSHAAIPGKDEDSGGTPMTIT